MSALTFVPGNVWVLSQRCFENKSLLNDSSDRRRWLYWLFQARRRFGLCVLNYVVMPNEIKLLVMDRGRGEIRSSMQMLAERMAADYNRRHHRRSLKKTPLWENEYQAYRLELKGYALLHCISDMDLSVVRAKLVTHPNLWPESGYHELHNPPQRARRVDFNALQRLLKPLNFSRLQAQRERWVKKAMELAASEGVYVPHPTVQSGRTSQVACGSASQSSSMAQPKARCDTKPSSFTLPLTLSNTGQPRYLKPPDSSAKLELVPKRYIT